MTQWSGSRSKDSQPRARHLQKRPPVQYQTPECIAKKDPEPSFSIHTSKRPPPLSRLLVNTPYAPSHIPPSPPPLHHPHPHRRPQSPRKGPSLKCQNPNSPKRSENHTQPRLPPPATQMHRRQRKRSLRNRRSAL